MHAELGNSQLILRLQRVFVSECACERTAQQVDRTPAQGTSGW
jgi:hypothetical protein